MTADDFRNCALVEGIVTTTDEEGSTHVSPIGPRVDWPTTRLWLRPYAESTTCRNLLRTRRGVFHVVDDVLLIARGAMGRWPEPPELVAAPDPFGQRLADCVRWYAFNVEVINADRQPLEMGAVVRHRGSVNEFFGFNRAQYAVIEAAILATRLKFLPSGRVRNDLVRLTPLVEKTGGDRERTAFAELQEYVEEQLAQDPARE